MSPTPGERSVSQLFGDCLAELAKLIQNEVALARAELRQKLDVATDAARLIGAGALLLIPALVLVLFAIASELIEFGLTAPLAYLLCGVGAAIVAVVLMWCGASRLSGDALKPSATLEEIRRDKTAAKELMR
jgi:hypothetical protein